jgi:hypothetical protein
MQNKCFVRNLAALWLMLALFAVSMPLRIWVGETEIWLRFADWLAS